jgi:phage anti-repressor protein
VRDLAIIESGLVPVYHGENGQIVDARELHSFLESKRQFSDWMKDRIQKYGFVENEDYVSLSQKCEGNNATRIDYHLTINTAKEIAMVENNEQGRKVRRYFIEVETRARQPAPRQMSQAELTAAIAQNQVELERKVNTALEVATEASRQINTALDTFTSMMEKDWKKAMNSKMREICKENGLSRLVFYGDLYKELEDFARVDLKSRLTRLRTRLAANGATKTACKEITKLEVIDRDPKLRPIFEEIVLKHQVKYAAV